MARPKKIVDLDPEALATPPAPKARLTPRDVKDIQLEARGTPGKVCEPQRADFSDTDLSELDLSGFDLRAAVFCNADLSRSNLNGANLQGCDFTGASLSGADLTDADTRFSVGLSG